MGQEQLAALAGVHVATVKNAEGDRPIGVNTVRQLYYIGLGKTDKAISEEEWHQLLAYWLMRDFEGEVKHGEVKASVLGAAIQTVKDEADSGSKRLAKNIQGVIEEMSPKDSHALTSLFAALSGPQRGSLLDAIRAIVSLSTPTTANT